MPHRCAGDGLCSPPFEFLRQTLTPALSPRKGGQRAVSVGSVEGVGVHAENAVGGAFVEMLGFGGGAGGAQGDVEGEKVFLGGVVFFGVGGSGSVGEEVFCAALHEGGVEPGGEVCDVVGGCAVQGAAPEAAEVVGEAAGGEDEDAFVAQGGEGSADGEVVGGAEVGLDGVGYDGDIGLGIHEHQRHPHSVVEAVARVGAADQAGLDQEVGRVFGEGRVAGGGVTHFEEAVVEAAEVVDGVGVGGCAGGREVGFVMGGYSEDGAGARQGGAEVFQEAPGGCVLEDEVGGAVADEDGGESGHWGAPGVRGRGTLTPAHSPRERGQLG